MSAGRTLVPNSLMMPRRSAAACCSSNHALEVLSVPVPFDRARSSTPRNATFMT